MKMVNRRLINDHVAAHWLNFSSYQIGSKIVRRANRVMAAAAKGVTKKTAMLVVEVVYEASERPLSARKSMASAGNRTV